MKKKKIITVILITIPLALLLVLIFRGLDLNPHRPRLEDINIPIIKLDNVDGLNMSRTHWRESKLTIIDENNEYEFDSHLVEVRGRGNSTWNTPPIPKRPYRFRFFSGDEHGVLGLEPARDFVLLANAYDNSHLRNYLGYTLARKISPEDFFQPSSIHVALFVNNDFRGIYLLTEQMQVHENRVNIDLERGDWYLELDWRASSNEIYQVGFIRSYFGRLNYPIDLTRTPGYASRTQQQRDDLQNLLMNFNNAILRKDNSFGQYINKESFINYFIIQELMQNLDISGNAHFQVVDGIIYMGPIWDLDNSSNNMRQGIRRYTRSTTGYQRMIAYERQGWFRYLMRNSSFAEAFYERWLQIANNELYELLNKEELLIERLAPVIYHEDLRWRHAWVNIFDLPHRRGMYRHFNIETGRLVRNSDFETYVNRLFDFFRRRSNFLTQKLGNIVDSQNVIN